MSPRLPGLILMRTDGTGIRPHKSLLILINLLQGVRGLMEKGGRNGTGEIRPSAPSSPPASVPDLLTTHELLAAPSIWGKLLVHVAELCSTCAQNGPKQLALIAVEG